MKNFKTNIQKLGRSMLLPVAAMPLAGLILRLAAKDMLNIPVLGAAGDAVFGNLDVLFAIGITLGFTKAKDKGIPALTAFLGIITLKAGLKAVDPAISMGIFGGIISGLIAAWTYDRFKNQKLPMVFSYFAGERFPLTMIMIIQTVMACILGFIWPIIQTGIDNFAKILVGMGALGVGIFVFLNRMLIPFGLHHVLNTYIYYDLGSYTSPSGEVFRGEITRFINGDPAAGLFLSGFFVVMMFGIPAICLAIYNTSFKKNKQMVKGVMGSGAATAFISNITEPVEFSFMFISPLLYFLHASLAALAGMVCYFFNIKIGFTFGPSIIDYIINFRIGTNAILIFPIGVVFFALYYFTFYYVIKWQQIPTLGRLELSQTDDVEPTLEQQKATLKSKNYEFMAKKLLEAFGGASNIEDAFSCNTRLRIEVKDAKSVNEDRIRQLGVSGLIKPSEDNYQVIIGLEVTYVMAEFTKLLDNK